MGDLSSWLLSGYHPEEIQELFADFQDIKSRFPEPLINLKQLPPLPRLAYLSMRGHLLSSTEGLAQYPLLETCIFSENDLELARFDGENPCLIDIDLSDNPLRTLDFSLGHPVVELDISRTRLLAFPDLSSCTSLSRLTGNGLHLKGIGNRRLPEMLRMLHVRNLRLSFNDWMLLPCGLTELRVGADAFPMAAQNQLSGLRTCFLHQLTEPVRLSMPNLEIASLDWFESRIQLEIGELPKLHTLRLPGCLPDYLPDISHLSNLKTVGIRFTRNELPALMQRFPNISEWKSL